MQFTVRALDARQQVHSLVLEALDEADARRQAAAQSLTPLTIRERGGAGGFTRPGGRGGFSLLLFAQELHALMVAGLSVIEALDALMEKDPHPERRAVLARLATQLREGLRLSAAMQAQPAVFPPLFVGIVQAAEGTSDLPSALSRYIDYETRLASVRHKVVSAAIYPAILVVAGTLVGLFLLGYVVPRFAAVYQGSGRELPWASQLLMGWGQFAAGHALPLAAGLAATAVAGTWWVRHQLAQGGWWRLLQVVPGARRHVRTLALSRLYLTLGMLLEGGIPLLQGLRLCHAVAGNEAAQALASVRADIESGASLSDALDRHGLSTPIALRLLRVGEQSGQLGAMLGRTAAFHEGEAARWIERFARAFEPILMAVIGIVIGLIVILLYMPVFDLAGSLQ